MKRTIVSSILTLTIFSTICTLASDQQATVLDPAKDYRYRHRDSLAVKEESGKGDHLMKMEIDLSHSGKKDVLFSYQKAGREDPGDENSVWQWEIYRKTADGRYTFFDKRKYVDLYSRVDILSGQSIEFDPTKIYVGYIKEIKAFGLLAMYWLPKHNEVIISAYVFHDGYFEALNFPDPNAYPGIYHRLDDGSIPDLPIAFRRYFSKPALKPVILP